MVMRLHDGGRHRRDTVDEDGRGEQRQQQARNRQTLTAVAAEQRHDRLCQHEHADCAGHSDQTHQPQGRILHHLDALFILERQMARDGGDNRCRDAGDERQREIEDRLTEAVDALGNLRGILRNGHSHLRAFLRDGEQPSHDAACADGGLLGSGDEAVHDRDAVKEVDDLQARRADRDRHSDCQKLLCGRFIGQRSPAEGGDFALVAAVLEEQVQRRRSRADADARDGRARGKGIVARRANDKPRKPQPEDQLAEGFDDLTDRRGRHVALPLEQAAARGGKADQNDRGTEGKNRVGRVGDAHDRARQQIRQEHHRARAEHADGQVGDQRGIIDALHLASVAERPRFGDHAAHCHGQTRRRNDEQHRVDVVSGGKIGKAVFPDEVLQRDLVEHSDDLDDDRREGQYRRTGQKVLLFDVTVFQNYPSFLSTNSFGMTYSASSFTTASRSMVRYLPAA